MMATLSSDIVQSFAFTRLLTTLFSTLARAEPERRPGIFTRGADHRLGGTDWPHPDLPLDRHLEIQVEGEMR
jgi:hypothetical protein